MALKNADLFYWNKFLFQNQSGTYWQKFNRNGVIIEVTPDYRFSQNQQFTDKNSKVKEIFKILQSHIKKH